MKSCVALLFASLLTLCEAQGTIETPVFVLKGRDLLLKLHADPPQGVLYVDWKINKTVTLVRFDPSGKPNVLHNLTGGFEFPGRFSVKLKNVQEANSGVYSAVAKTLQGDKLLAEYKVTVQGPVSPVELIVDRVDSSSSESCDLHVTCRTHNSHISSTFRCVDRVCSQEGGERSEVTTSGASLQFYLLNNMIICNHRNQHHMTQDLIPAEPLCPSKPDSPIGLVIGVSIGVTVTLVMFVVLFVWLYNRQRRRIKEERWHNVHLQLQEQASALQDQLTAHLIAEQEAKDQRIREEMKEFYVLPILYITREIYSNVKKVKVNKRRSQLVRQRVKALVDLVWSIKEAQTSYDVQEALMELKDTLKTALSLIESHTEDSWGEHMLLKTDSHEDEFVNVNERLSDAFQILSGALNEDQIRKASRLFDRDSMMKEDEEAKKKDEAALKTPLTEQHIRKLFFIKYVWPIRFIASEIYSHVKKVKVNKRRSQLVCQRSVALVHLVMSIKEDQATYDELRALREVKDTLKTALSLIESHTEDSWGERMLLKADSHEDEFVYVNKRLSDAFQILSGVLNKDQIREASKVFDRDSMMKEDEEAKKKDEAALKTLAAAGVNTTAPGGCAELTG